MEEIIKNYNNIVEQIRITADEADRNVEEIKLIIVTKKFNAESIKPLLDIGHLYYGENRVQEAKEKFSNLGVESIIYTDISKDGLLKGPNIEKIQYYKNLIKVPLIASGGVSSLEDLLNLANIKTAGVIVGKAIYDKKINLSNMFNIGKQC